MNRKLIIEKLLMEGFSDKTLSRLSDSELITLSNTVLKEAGSVMMKKTSTDQLYQIRHKNCRLYSYSI